MRKQVLLIIAIFCVSLASLAQVNVSGVVYAQDGESTLPFATIKSVKTSKTTQTDIDGKYSISLPSGDDSLRVLAFGIKPKSIYVTNESIQIIDIYTGEDAVELEKVVLVAAENPAFNVLREINRYKKQNDYSKSSGYKYDSYSRIEVDADNITEKFKEKKILQKIGEAVQELDLLKDEDGNDLLPIYIFETVSKFSAKNNPYTQKETVVATKASGLGIEDGGLVSQFVGASYQQFNLYDNTITAFGKELLSPVSAFWKSNYKYMLLDTSIIYQGDSVYYIKFRPKRAQDLAFVGEMYIGYSDYAIRRLEMKLQETANLNFIDKLSINREWKKSEESFWFPKDTYLEVGVKELSKNMTGLLIRTRTAYSNVKLIDEFPDKHFEYGLDLADDRRDKSEKFWKENRADSLTADELRANELVKEVSDSPIVKSYLDIIDAVFGGRYPILNKKIWLGTYSRLYAYNTIEKHRLRLGFKTFNEFSSNIQLQGYTAYGTGDNAWKYGAKVKIIVHRKPWTELQFASKNEIDLLGITGLVQSELFDIFTKWGTQSGAMWNNEQSVSIYRQLNRHFSTKIKLKHNEKSPLFNYAYHNPNNQSEIKSNLTTNEIVTSLRFAKNEVYAVNGINRKRLGGSKWPTFDLDYTYGASGVLGSDLEYHRLDLTVFKKIGLGGFGRTKFWIKGGKIFNPVPLHLLKVHLGNPTPFYSVYANNTMNFFEFASDEYIQFTHVHRFDGFFMNRIPLIKKLKWRAVMTSNIVWGGLSEINKKLDASGNLKLNTLEAKPYAEIGYGLENIFKFLRVQIYHRLSYTDLPKAQNLTIKAAILVTL